MKVDFNNLRRKALNAYDKLCSKLNNAVEDEKVIIDNDDLKNVMDDLRSCLIGIGCSYMPDDPDCICIIEDDETIPKFLPKEI